jgi:very-short-patch-repair endonuclease
MRLNYRPYLKEKARELRNNTTFAEKIFWGMVKGKQLGYDFHRQKPIGNFIYDFYSKQLNLVVEIDGATHLDETVQANDVLKTKFAESLGLRIIRFTDEEVTGNGDLLMLRLKQIIAEIQNTSKQN